MLCGREARPLVDKEERVFGVVAGRPRDREGWDMVERDATQALREAREACSLSAQQSDHRRGRFPALAVGVSYGGGQRVWRAHCVLLYVTLSY